MRQVISWVIYGKLKDPHHEFFISCDESLPDELMTGRKSPLDHFSIHDEFVPTSFSKDLVQKIFSIGLYVVIMTKATSVSHFKGF